MLRFSSYLIALLAWAFSPPVFAAPRFPADAGFLNVRDFGAKGDGVQDDTAAINAALTASGGDAGPTFWHDRIVYLPDGVYMVSGPIAKRYANGKFGSGSILIGESREKTIIRLADHASGYDQLLNPKAVIFTTAKLLDGNATSGGKDYLGKGEGNDAFMNFVEHLTVDVGQGNPGAIGIDYLANNMGAIRDVKVKADASSGAIGISLKRKWAGPALIQHTEIEGFQTGIETANTEYGITLEALKLHGQSKIGIKNDHNILSMRNVTIEGAPAPLINNSADGLIVLLDGRISGQGEEAIRNAGTLNLRDIKVEGYRMALGVPLSGEALEGIYQGNQRLSASATDWSLPIENPPATKIDPVERWASVARYGAAPDDDSDATQAIRAAFASGKNTVYFPHGTYLISDNIVVPPTVERIVGMTSTIHAVPKRPGGFKRDLGMFRAENDRSPLIIEQLAFDNSYLGEQVAVEADGSRPLVLRDVIAGGVSHKRPATGGKLFMENTCCGNLDVSGQEGVWARQLNTEGGGGGTHLTNHGSPLWILGIKTEGDSTVLDNQPGSVAEVLGGLLYPVKQPNPELPAFRNKDARISLTYAEEAFDPKRAYTVHLLDNEQGQDRPTMAESLPVRNKARMAAHLVVE